jgi:signal transduction histidine kinase
VQFRGDEALLRRLAINLLDNAIRYTPPGGKVSAVRFYRAGKARSRPDGGFGLGLSIVKWIAESHRGSVELTPNRAPGTTFTVTLPRQKSAATHVN